jgi:hypothetical protein
MTACRVKPWDTYSVTFFDEAHLCSNGNDQPDRFMTWNERERRLHRPISECSVEVRVAHATCFGLHHDLTWARGRNIPLPQYEGLAKLLDYSGIHLGWHM